MKVEQVKRFRANPRYTVETEFDDAQFVRVEDYDALLARVESVREHVSNICKAAGNQPSIATGYIRDVLDKLNGEL